MTTKNFIFIFLSLYTIQSCGMENTTTEIERRTRKHTENSLKRESNKFGITALCKLLKPKQPEHLNSINLRTQEKKSLQISLEQKVRSLNECYSAGETWSGDDHNAYRDGKQAIELLKEQSNQ